MFDHKLTYGIYKTPTIQQSAHNIQFGTKHDKGI